MEWLWNGYGMVMEWLWNGYGMVMEWLWNGYGMVKTPIEVRLKSDWNGIVEQRFRFWILKIPIFISKNEEEDDQDHDQNYFL